MRRMFGFLIGIFTGALVGSVIALLLAPDPANNCAGNSATVGKTSSPISATQQMPVGSNCAAGWIHYERPKKISNA